MYARVAPAEPISQEPSNIQPSYHSSGGGPAILTGPGFQRCDPDRTPSDSEDALTPEGNLSSSPVPPRGDGAPRAEAEGGHAPLGAEAGRAGERGVYPDVYANNLLESSHYCPGHNKEPTRDSCGDLHHWEVCPDCQYAKAIMDSCYATGCPECWPRWAARAAERGADRTRGYMQASRIPYDPSHIDISLSPDIYQGKPTGDACREALAGFSKVVKKLGAHALAVTVHPYRFKPGMRDRAEAEASRFDGNAYRWVLGRDDWRDYLYLSPHIHALTFGYLKPSAWFYEKTGWRYTNHGQVPPDNLEKVLYYLLGHSWVLGNNKAIRYWGGLSTRRLGFTEKREYQVVECPRCETPLRKILPTDNYQFLENAPEAMHYVILRSYFIKSKGASGPPTLARHQAGVIS